jgi:hypothetical protein
MRVGLAALTAPEDAFIVATDETSSFLSLMKVILMRVVMTNPGAMPSLVLRELSAPGPAPDEALGARPDSGG